MVSGAQHLQTIDLRQRPAEDVIPLIKPFLRPGDGISGSGFTLFVRTDAATLEQIRQMVATLDQVWADVIANSDALKAYAANRGALFAPFAGEDAQERVQPAIRNNAWLLFDAGKATVSPDSVGIPRP